MSREEQRKVRLAKYNRDGINTLSEVSAFLGGIFFTGLLILVQQREKFDIALLVINLREYSIRISQLHLIAIPLSISVIFYIFSSIFFGIACSKVTQEELDELADDAALVFVVGLFSTFISLFVVLLLVDIVVGVLGIILSVGTLIWWIKKRERTTIVSAA